MVIFFSLPVNIWLVTKQREISFEFAILLSFWKAVLFSPRVVTVAQCENKYRKVFFGNVCDICVCCLAILDRVLVQQQIGLEGVCIGT